MKIDAQCVPCLLKRVLFETGLASSSDSKKTKAVKEACRALSLHYDSRGCSAAIATAVHRAVYDALGTTDPYYDLKRRSTREAMGLMPTVERLLNESADRMKTSLLCAGIANMLDFGIEGAEATPEQLSQVFTRLYQEGFGHDDSPLLKQLLSRSRRLVFFADNCGEHVFDKVLCRELRRAYPDLSITLVVKGVPILSDATLEDAAAVGFSEVVSSVLTTEAFAVGVPVPLPKIVASAVAGADLVLSKGMANYESLSETSIRPIAHLLRTKCAPIAASLGLPAHISVLKVYD